MRDLKARCPVHGAVVFTWHEPSQAWWCDEWTAARSRRRRFEERLCDYMIPEELFEVTPDGGEPVRWQDWPRVRLDAPGRW